MFIDSAMLPWFVAASSLVMMLFLVAGGRKDPALRPSGRPGVRRMPLSGDQRKRAARSDEPRSGQAVAVDLIEQQLSRRLEHRGKHEELKQRMVQAGMYEPKAVNVFFLVRLTLMLGLAAMGYLASRLGYLSMSQGVLFGLSAGIAGTLAPGLWLDYLGRRRQTKIRRALPDALDVIGICLEAGLSLNAALSRVAHELVGAHPLLATELKIVERQIQLGRTTAVALRELANRFDLEELRGLSSVVSQSETIGSSMASAMAVFGNSLRIRRQQRAEEMAHKASVKMLFPMMSCIFPAMLVVILGPAVIKVYQQFIVGVMHAGH
jgi:tight adherence protein C